MPRHAARRARPVWYVIAGVLVASVLVLVAGPSGARALVRASSSVSASPSAEAASAEASPSAASPTATKASASAKASSPYRVVGLGDSVPAGSNCGCTSYVSLVGNEEAARRGTTADVSNLAKGGLTTSGLLDQLDDASVKSEIAAADLVIVTIGANDFDTDAVGDDSCAAPGLDCFQSTLQQQQSQLTALFAKLNTNATVLVTGYWNVFLDGDVAAAKGEDYVRNSVSLTQAENSQIAGVATAQDATYVDIFAPFKGTSGTDDDTDLLADDGDHPNAAGHRKIADALEATLNA